MPYQISEGKTASEELGQSIGSSVGLALVSPIGAAAVLGGLKFGAKTAWKTAKVAGPPIGKAIWGGMRTGAGPATKVAGSYASAGIRGALSAAKTVAGGSVYGAAKVGAWIYKNPGTALIAAAPIGIGMAAYNSEANPENIIGSPNMTELQGGSSGSAGVNELMDSLNATGDVVLGMHRSR